jgi:magnesium chelatase subunit D
VTTAPLGDAYRARLLTVAGVGAGQAGRRSRARTDSGRRVGAARPTGPTGSLHLLETVRAAAPHQRVRGRDDGPLVLAASDLRVAVKEGHESNLVLFCVDASGSMAARRRMREVKTAILSLLTDAYQRRDKVGLITFRGDHAELALPPTGSVEVAVARLRELPAGGRTPLAEALTRVAEVLRVERLRDPRRRPLLVLVTDGRATYGPDAVPRSHRVAAALRHTGVSTVVIDCEDGRFRMGLAVRLAAQLGATPVPIADVDASALTQAARRVAGGAA